MDQNQETPLYGLDVRTVGAVGDGSTDDAPAIQRALDGGERLVVIPAGTYRIGATLRVRSGTHLIAHRAAHIRLADGAAKNNRDFLLCNANFEGDQNITVEGGVWDGNNRKNPRGPDAPTSYSGVMIDFRRMRGLRISGMTVRDPESYYIRLGECRDFLVDRIQFEAQHLRPNQDGVHLGGGCEDGEIRDLAAVGPYCTSDDIVALNADDACGRAQNLDLICGPIRRIRVENVTADTCHTFVRLLSVQSVIEDVIVTNVRGGCRVAAVNMDSCRDCLVKLFDPADPQYRGGVGDIRRVTFRHMRVWKGVGGGRGALLDMRSKIDGFVIEDLARPAELDGAPACATLACSEHAADRVEIEGLDEKQREATVAASRDVALSFQRMVHSSGERRMRADARVGGGRLVLPGGGFSRLIAGH
jgi:hypothetical protein